jgi:hypothetical protein
MMHDHVNGIGVEVLLHDDNHDIATWERKARQTKAHRVITAQGASTEAETEPAPERNLMTRIST